MNTLAKAKSPSSLEFLLCLRDSLISQPPEKNIETTLLTFSLFFEAIEQTRDHQSSHVNRKKRRNYKYGKIVNR